MKYLFLTLILTFFQNICFAQEIKLTSKSNPDKSVSINAEGNFIGTRTVVIYFSHLENCIEASTIARFVKCPQNILYLRPTDTEKYIDYSFSYRYVNGNALLPPNKDFVYRLPYSTTANRKCRSLSFFGLGDQKQPEDWYPLQFELEKGDTIYASRKGTVIKIKNDIDPMQGVKNVTMRTEQNYVRIEHSDGSVAAYNVLEKNSIMVKEGDVVYPGDPLALAGTYENEKYQLRFNISYYTLNPNYKNISLGKDTFIPHNIRPIFATTSGETILTYEQKYTPVSSEGLVIKEMTKKELKKYKAK